jgi:hypothetical protein
VEQPRNETVDENRYLIFSAALGFRHKEVPMKNLRSILAALTVLLMATAAHAQSIAVKATIPFNFVVGDRAYPAGEYSFRENGVILQIADTDNIATSNVISNACESVNPSEKTKLVFHRMGGYYFLSQVWVSGNTLGRELPRSDTEVRLAQNHEKSEPVIVAANLSR